MPVAPADRGTIQRIQQILTRYEAVLSPCRRRKLNLWLDLLHRLRPGEIIVRHNVTREGLRKIRRKIQDEGWTSLVVELRQQLEMIEAKRRAPKLSRGRPRNNTLVTTFSDDFLNHEPVVALASIVLGEDLQFAVFAVRDRPAPKKDTLAKKTLAMRKSVAAVCRRPMSPQWTRGNVDEWIRKPLMNLRIRFAQMQAGRRRGQPRITGVPALASRFAEDWWFIVLCAGTQCENSPVIQRFVRNRSHKLIHLDGTLLDRLEAILYTLRVTQNFRGLLPFLGGLDRSAAKWDPVHASFKWNCDESEIMAGLKKRVFDFYVRAACGYMFDLSGWVRDWIPRSERFRVMSLPTTPEITIEPAFAGSRFGKFAPFPELVISLDLTWNEASRLSDERLRRGWREGHGFAAFDYVVRRPPRQRANMDFPFDLDPKLPPELLPVALVPVPRQFLMPPSAASLPQMELLHAEIGTEADPPVRNIEVAGEQALLFLAPELLVAIGEAFHRNRYGDRVAVIQACEDWWWKLLSGPARKFTTENPQSGESPQVLPMFEPPFDFSRPGLRRPIMDEATLGKMRDVFIPDPAPFGGLARSRSDYPSAPADYVCEKTLRGLYKTFDADFLLRELTPHQWNRLVRLAEQWSRAVRMQICRVLFSDGPLRKSTKTDTGAGEPFALFDNARLNLDEVMRMVPKKLKRLAGAELSSLPTWVFEALSKFESSPRVLRSALENAQKFVLAGLEPRAMVVRTSRDIFRSWWGYFAVFIQHKLIPDKDRNQPPTVELEPDTELSIVHARESSIDETEVSEICDIVEQLAKSAATSSLLDRFARLAKEGDFSMWLAAIQRIQAANIPGAIIPCVTRALEKFRSESGDSPENRRAVEADFARARGS